MVVTGHIAVLVVLALFTLRDPAGDVHWGWRDVVAKPSREAVIQDVAAEAVEVSWAVTVIVRLL